MNGVSHLRGFRVASFVSPFPVCLYFPSARPDSVRSGEVAECNRLSGKTCIWKSAFDVYMEQCIQIQALHSLCVLLDLQQFSGAQLAFRSKS